MSGAIDQAERIIAANLNSDEIVLEDIGLVQLEPLLPLLARMPQLRVLKLARNKLTGIPSDLSAIRRLEYLDVSQNPITGLNTVMRGLYGLAALKHLYIDLPLENEEDEIILSLQSLESFNGTSLLDEYPSSTPPAAQQQQQQQQQQRSVPVTSTGASAPRPNVQGSIGNYGKSAGLGSGSGAGDTLGAYWTASDADQVEQLYAAVNVVVGRATNKEEFEDYTRNVVKHLETLTAAEEDVFHRRGEVLKAKKILFEYCFEEIVRGVGRKDQSISNSLAVVLESYTALLDNYADLWRKIADDREEKMDVMKKDMQSAIEEIESLMQQVEQQQQQHQQLQQQQQQQQGQKQQDSAGGAVDLETFQRMQEEMGWLRTENERLQTRLRQTEAAQQMSEIAQGGAGGVNARPGNESLDRAGSGGLQGKRSMGRSQAPPSTLKVLTLKQLKDTIEDIYASKSKYDIKCAQSHLPRETMEQHMYTYLNQRYGLKHIILDWATAIIQGIKKYAPDDNDVAVFGKILRNEIDEEFRFVQRQVRETVHALLRVHVKGERPSKSDADIDNIVRKKVNGTLTEAEWTDVVRYMYNNEDAVSIIMRIRDYLRQLAQPRRRRAVLRGQPMEEDVNGRLQYADFLGILLSFQLEGHERFLRTFVSIFRRHDADGNGIVNEREFRGILRTLDPSKTDEEIDAVLELIDPYSNQLITFSECVTFLSAELVAMMEEQNHAASN